MSRSTNAIKLLARAKIEALRSTEAVSVLPETLHISVDPDDELFDNGADDPPSPALVQSIRNGWIPGNSIIVVNRGTKDAPIPFIVAGRSRKKAAIIVNEERVKEGLEPGRVDIVFCPEEDAYAIMLLENNKQERSPLYNPRRWQTHKRRVARKLNKATLSDDEKAEARKEFAAFIGVDDGTIATWETMLEAPTEVLAMVDRGELSATDAKALVKHAPVAARVEKAVQIAKGRKDGSAKGMTKKEHREAVLGKDRPLGRKQIQLMVRRADALGIDDAMKMRIRDEDSTLDLDAVVAAAMADGFTMLGKLLTGEIKAEDLPEPLRQIALAAKK